MPKKSTSSTSKSKPAAKKTSTSPVRKTTVPRASKPAAVAAPAPKSVTHDDIARRAYELWQSGMGSSDFDRWCQAERELRG